MKRILIRVGALLAALTLGVTLWVPGASAASATSNVSVSPSSVDPGANFTVTVRVSGNALGSVEGYLTYDASKVEFVSGAGANGAGGSVKLSAYDNNGNGSSSLSCTMTFTAKAAGSTAMSFKPSEVTAVENGQVVEISASSASATVTVKAPAALSGNANLSSLKPSQGTLSPAFSPNTTSYTVTVPNSVEHVYLSAKPQEAGATQADSGSGTQVLPVGTTTRVITVTAPNGATKKYTVKITRQPAEGQTVSETPVSSAEELVPVRNEVTVSVDGRTMTVVEDLTDVEIPAGFEQDFQAINDNSVVCVRNAAGIPLLYLIDDAGAGFYVYDSETISFTPFDTITIKGVPYLLLEKPRNIALPKGFAAAEVAVGERTLSGWRSEEDEAYCLLYLCGPGEYKGFYLYDSVEETAMRYAPVGAAAAVAPVEKEEQPLNGPAAFFAAYWLYAVAGAGAVILGLTLALILVAVKKRKAPSQQKNEAEKDDFLDDLDGMIFDFEPEKEKPGNHEEK